MSKITFIPVGGLANRMRAIASAFDLCKKTNGSLNVVWIKDWALNSPFYELFEPINDDVISLRDASTIDKLLLDRPRKKNFYLPRIYQKLIFDSSLYELSITPLCRKGFDFVKWAIGNKELYLASYTNFMNYDISIISKLFRPLPEIKKMIDTYTSQFTDDTIGLHIRRTDNLDSIINSPIELFYNKIDKEIDANNAVNFFLATDCEDVKKEMQKRYGSRIICSKEVADRDSIEGIKGAVAEMYVLSSTQKIYGSFQSSYSDMASQISGIPLEILKL